MRKRFVCYLQKFILGLVLDSVGTGFVLLLGLSLDKIREEFVEEAELGLGSGGRGLLLLECQYLFSKERRFDAPVFSKLHDDSLNELFVMAEKQCILGLEERRIG